MTVTPPPTFSFAQWNSLLKQFRPGPDGPPLVVVAKAGSNPVALSRQNSTHFIEAGIPQFFEWGETLRRQMGSDELRPIDYRPLPDDDHDWERTATFFRPSDGHLIRVGERIRRNTGLPPQLKAERQYRIETGYCLTTDRQIVQETILNHHQVTAVRYTIGLHGASVGVVADRFGYKKEEGNQLVGDLYRRLVEMMVQGASATVGMRIEGQADFPEHRRVDASELRNNINEMSRRLNRYRQVSIGPLYRSVHVAGLNNFEIRYAHPDDAAEQLDFSLHYILDNHSDLPPLPETFRPLWQQLLRDHTD